MKKLIWAILILAALGAIGYFIGYPYVVKTHPEWLELIGIQTEKQVEDNIVLAEYNGNDGGLEIKEGWVAPVRYEYARRDIPSIEQEFYALGYPSFLYVTDDQGNLNQLAEKSFRDDGALIYLYMDDTFYLTEASIEYGVPKNKFNSTSMNEHIGLYTDFIRIITNHEVSEEDKNELLRLFSNIFNNPDSKSNSIEINGLRFTVSLDLFYNLIIMKC